MLPKNINVYSLQEIPREEFPEELRGFISNSYFFNTKLSYRPKITFEIISYKDCEIDSIRNGNGLIVIFDLEEYANEIKQDCLDKIRRLNVFYISKINTSNIANSFIVSPNSERSVLMKTIPIKKKKFGFVTSLNAKDIDSEKELIAINKNVLNTTVFDDTKNSQVLFSEILLTDRSNERKRKLARRLSKTLAGDARSRGDLDSFFFSVNLKEARILKPALDFISEDKYELYLLNSWESEDSYLIGDKDLIGSINSDMPVMMPVRLPEYLPNNARNRGFAIGYDAFQIILIRYGVRNLRGVTYKGLTGKITFLGRSIIREPYAFMITDEGYKIL